MIILKLNICIFLVTKRDRCTNKPFLSVIQSTQNYLSSDDIQNTTEHSNNKIVVLI